MHQSHHGLPAFFIPAGVALVFVVIVAAGTVLIQRRMYAGPLQDRCSTPGAASLSSSAGNCGGPTRAIAWSGGPN